jgi:hypothetical protein
MTDQLKTVLDAAYVLCEAVERTPPSTHDLPGFGSIGSAAMELEDALKALDPERFEAFLRALRSAP